MKFLISGIITLLLAIANIFIGSVSIPANEVINILMGGDSSSAAYSYIVLQSRIPQLITAAIAGASLAASGLMLQTAFRNPLASPSILGITSGASLGVAVVTLFTGSTILSSGALTGGFFAVITAAFAGSLATMAILLALSAILKNDLLLLITGVLIGYLVSSVITILNFSATADGIQSYTIWGMGSFASVPENHLPIFGATAAAGILLSLLLIKPLNIIQLGSAYAQNLGINLTLVRNTLLLSTGILTAAVTAYCGPVAFIGLAVPHITRMIFNTADHRTLLPATLLCGSCVALLCNLLCALPPNGVLPLNAVTPLIGVPVIIYVILRRRQ